MTVEDRLLESRLAKNSHAAYAACQQRLNELSLSACLMDVEHLFDGRTLVFYFLGDVPPQVEQLKDELAEVYEVQAQFRTFADALTQGCGPDCGTESAAGHGCGSCSTGCAVADSPARRGSTRSRALAWRSSGSTRRARCQELARVVDVMLGCQVIVPRSRARSVRV